MAKQIVTNFVDDLDGTKAEGTVSFTFDGQALEIDLSKKNRTALEKLLAPYLGAARKASGSTRGRKAKASTSVGGAGKRTDLEAVRAWAKDNGHQVADRGRVAAAVLEAYNAAQ